MRNVFFLVSTYINWSLLSLPTPRMWKPKAPCIASAALCSPAAGETVQKRSVQTGDVTRMHLITWTHLLLRAHTSSYRLWGRRRWLSVKTGREQREGAVPDGAPGHLKVQDRNRTFSVELNGVTLKQLWFRSPGQFGDNKLWIQCC